MTVNDDELIGLRTPLTVAAGDPEDDDLEDINDDDEEDDGDGTEDEEPAEIREPPDDD
jgi:hypothetical protein